MRELLPQTRWVVTQVAVDHLFARRAGERPLEILSDAVVGPKGDGARLGLRLGRSDFRDERVVCVHDA
jgi:hypothetical protein